MYIVVDIGGTKTRIAGSRDLESFSDPIIVESQQQYDQAITTLVQTARLIAKGEAIDALAIGLPGVLSRDKRVLFDAQNASLWDKHSVAADIEKDIGTRVYLENDTALVGLGESHFGAGVGIPIMVYMTVSTGVNAVRIVDGRIDRADFGSEVGDQYLIVGDKAVQLGDLISGKAISKKYGKPPRELGKDSPVWEELAKLTAFGLYNSILHWSPQRVVLGGSMFNDIGISPERVLSHIQNINANKLPELPEIVHSQLGDVGGLWGGLALLKQRLS